MRKIYGVVFNKGELTNSWTVKECYSNKLTIRWNEICGRNKLNTFQQTDETGLDAFTCWVSACSCNEAHDKAREYYSKYYISPEPPKYSGKFIFSFHSDLIESEICSPADNNFDDFENNFITEDPDDTVSDTLDDLAVNVEDMQDQIDDVDEDEPSIDVDNNIEGHYIAECERCHGIFISAMIESDQEVEKISGVCPLCEKETDQYLKWVVKSVE